MLICQQRNFPNWLISHHYWLILGGSSCFSLFLKIILFIDFHHKLIIVSLYILELVLYFSVFKHEVQWIQGAHPRPPLSTLLIPAGGAAAFVLRRRIPAHSGAVSTEILLLLLLLLASYRTGRCRRRWFIVVILRVMEERRRRQGLRRGRFCWRRSSLLIPAAVVIISGGGGGISSRNRQGFSRCPSSDDAWFISSRFKLFFCC